MDKIYEALGWQGGTIHQILEEIERLKAVEKESKKIITEAFEHNDHWGESNYHRWSKSLEFKAGSFLRCCLYENV